MTFTLGAIATSGYPEGQYIVRVDDIEAGRNAGNTGDTIKFSVSCQSSENSNVKPGQKQVWSYTYASEYRNILANDLVKAGLPRETQLTGESKQDALIFANLMRGNLYILAVVGQKKDPSRTNSHFIGPYQAGAVAAPLPAAGPPASVMTSTAPPPVAAVAPPPIMAVPAAVAPAAPPLVQVAAPGAPAPPAPEEPQLDAALIDAVMKAKSGQGTFPVLNGRQIAQLREIGMVEVAAQYEAVVAPQPASAYTPPPLPPAAPVTPGAAFAAV